MRRHCLQQRNAPTSLMRPVFALRNSLYALRAVLPLSIVQALLAHLFQLALLLLYIEVRKKKVTIERRGSEGTTAHYRLGMSMNVLKNALFRLGAEYRHTHRQTKTPKTKDLVAERQQS